MNQRLDMSAPIEKVVEVEPAEEGPKVKAKRQMTEAQLAALKKGREKLAEKRKAAVIIDSEESKVSTVSSEVQTDAQTPTPNTNSNINTTLNEDEEEQIEGAYHPLCLIV